MIFLPTPEAPQLEALLISDTGVGSSVLGDSNQATGLLDDIVISLALKQCSKNLACSLRLFGATQEANGESVVT